MPRRLTAAALLFDNDGVLSDSRASVDACWRRWAIEFGLDADSVLAFIHGRPARRSISMLAPHLDVDAAAARLEDLEVAGAAGTRPMPGAAELVAALDGCPWIVVTSGTRRLAAARLHAAGVEPPAMVTADDVTSGKPDPEPYLAAARRLGVDPAECIVFEDTAAGVTAGRAAGAVVVGITSGSGVDLGAHYHIADLRCVRVECSEAGVNLDLATA